MDFMAIVYISSRERVVGARELTEIEQLIHRGSNYLFVPTTRTYKDSSPESDRIRTSLDMHGFSSDHFALITIRSSEELNEKDFGQYLAHVMFDDVQPFIEDKNLRIHYTPPVFTIPPDLQNLPEKCKGEGSWELTLLDNKHTTVSTVNSILTFCLGMNNPEAEILISKIHNEGKYPVATLKGAEGRLKIKMLLDRARIKYEIKELEC